MMNVVLILPNYNLPVTEPCCYPIGFMMVSAVLKQLGHRVKVLNTNVESHDLEELHGADAVLFTGFHRFAEFNQAVAGWCRERGIHTVIGGELATFKPLEMLQHFDAVVVGEGELVIEQALTFRGIIQGKKPNLDTLPYPDYEGFGIDRYNELHNTRFMGVLTSRGCPHSCRFCAHTCAFQFRGLESVFAEIDEYRAAYGVALIVFNDNTLNVRKDRFLTICEGMKERGLIWGAAIRADVFDEEMAKAAKDSGCHQLLVGVESFIDAKLEAMNKQITSAQIIAALDLLNKYEIGYYGNVLLGLPGESYDDIIAEVAAIPPGYAIRPILVKPHSGTEYQTRSISDAEAQHLDKLFTEHAYAMPKGRLIPGAASVDIGQWSIK